MPIPPYRRMVNSSPPMASRFSSRLLRHLHGRRHMFTAEPRRLVPAVLDSPSRISQTFPLSLRFLSTRPLRPTRAKKPDIGARARQLQSRRLWAYGLSFSGVAGFIIIVLYQFQDQLVFYVTPTEVLDKYNSNPAKSKFRLGGLVLENSVAEIPYSPEIHFVVTDLITDILVKYEGSLPDLFREGHSVVVEGFVRPVEEEIKKKEEANLNSNKLGVMGKARNLDCYFMASEVLAKHDEKYMPAEVAAAIEKNKKLIEEEQKKEGEALSSSSS